MNKRRARERRGHPQLGVQCRAARRVRRCGSRRREAGGGERVGGAAEDRVRCRGAMQRCMDLVWTDVAETSKFGGEPATLSTFQGPRSNAEISRKKFDNFTQGLAGLWDAAGCLPAWPKDSCGLWVQVLVWSGLASPRPSIQNF